MKPATLGRPKVKATRAQVEALRKDRYTWEAIAAKLGISRSTVIRIYHSSRPLRPHITYRAEKGVIIAECGDASAIYVVAEKRYSANPADTDECPITEDGCWPIPPARIQAQAR